MRGVIMVDKSKQDKLKETLKIQWFKKNVVLICILALIILAIYILAGILDNLLILSLNTILAFCIYLYMRNKMMSFIENEIYIKKY